jgi:signal transduction histidine kinase
MKKFSFKGIVVIFTILFLSLTYEYYQQAKHSAIDNATFKVDELLLNYQAFRNYVSNIQKEEIYRLQKKGSLDKSYFHPEVMSSTYSARGINIQYNKLREKKGLAPIVIRFASDHPRNSNNLATPKEAKLLKLFNENKIKEYKEIVKKDGKTIFYYVLPTKRTTKKCMRCHSDPKIAPKGLVDIYGDKNGFHEKVGKIRAILSTSYPMDYDLKEARKTFYTMTITTLLVFLILLFIVYRYSKNIDDKKEELADLNKTLDNKVYIKTKELYEEKNYIKKILDVNPSIIIVSNGKEIFNVNAKFLEFFQYKNLEDFQKEHSCVCEYFTLFEDKEFPKDRKIDGELWSIYITKQKQKTFTIAMEKENKKYYFNLSVILLEGKDILITMQDITEVKEKEVMLVQQSKMASLGEMLTNIAHQWRQPLSMISTSATGIMMQKEFGVLTDEKLLQSMNDINNSAQFLSTTIDDFRNFFKQDKELKSFKLCDVIEKTLKLLESNFKTNNITIEILCSDINVVGYDTELIQVMMNILNNARDAFKEQNMEYKCINITSEVIKNNVHIIIHDNANGIPSKIITKIFEPYFTTKHQSQGTGIGLYMSYEIITKNMKGKLIVKNEHLKFKNTKRLGAKFEIVIPKEL